MLAVEQRAMSVHRIPPNFFGIPFGLAGLAGCWLTMASFGAFSDDVGNTLLILATVVWGILVISYVLSAVADRSTVGRDLRDPIAAPFLSLALIVPMLLASQGLFPQAPTAGKVTFDVFLVATVIVGGWLTGQWIYRPLELDTFHPGYFLPTVAGGLIAAAGAAEVGQRRLGEAMFGLGLICWLMLGSLILGRLLFRPLPPDPLLPTLAIEVAPAAVASLAYFAIHGGRIDGFAAALGGYGLLMVLAQLRLLPIYFRLRFMPSTWAFTFSWAAVASAAMHWLNELHPTGYRAWQYVLLAAITGLIGAIAIRTVVALGKRQLLPAAAPGATPASEVGSGRTPGSDVALGDDPS